MLTALGNYDIDGIGGIELVDLIMPVDNRHIPSEQIDEQALAISEHGAQQGLTPSCDGVIDDMDHGNAPALWLSRTKEAAIGGANNRAVRRQDIWHIWWRDLIEDRPRRVG